MTIHSDGQGTYWDSSGQRLTKGPQGVLSDNFGVPVGYADPMDSFATKAPPSGSSGDGLVVLLAIVFGWPVFLELLIVFIGTYGLFSPLADWMRIPRFAIPPSLGFHPIAGLCAASVVSGVYAYSHGFRSIAVLLGLTLTFLWASVVLVAINADQISTHSLRDLLIQGDAAAALTVLEKLKWGWVLATIGAALVGRYMFAKFFQSSVAHLPAIRSWRDVRRTAKRAARSLMEVIVATVCIYALVQFGGYLRRTLAG